MKTIASLLFAAALLSATAARAEDLQFQLRNQTSTEIVALQVSTVHTDSWEENLIAGYVLPAGNEMDVVIADGARTCRYDLLITFADDTHIEDRDVDLCELGTYTAED
ncbi:hypothetical protein [Endothiovibrio diazotrophicus]